MRSHLLTAFIVSGLTLGAIWLLNPFSPRPEYGDNIRLIVVADEMTIEPDDITGISFADGALAVRYTDETGARLLTLTGSHIGKPMAFAIGGAINPDAPVIRAAVGEIGEMAFVPKTPAGQAAAQSLAERLATRN